MNIVANSKLAHSTGHTESRKVESRMLWQYIGQSTGSDLRAELTCCPQRDTSKPAKLAQPSPARPAPEDPAPINLPEHMSESLLCVVNTRSAAVSTYQQGKASVLTYSKLQVRRIELSTCHLDATCRAKPLEFLQYLSH